jgi:hypothetical protein
VLLNSQQSVYATVVVIVRSRRMDSGSKADDHRLIFLHGLRQTLFYGRNPYLVILIFPFACMMFQNGLFAICQPGPWRQRRHSEGNTAPLPAKEGVLECPGPSTFGQQSSTGSSGRLDRPRDHFLRSIDRRRQP